MFSRKLLRGLSDKLDGLVRLQNRRIDLLNTTYAESELRLNELATKIDGLETTLRDSRSIDIAQLTELAAVHKDIFDAGVAANKMPVPEQFMMTPEQILAEQARMETDAAWVVSGGSDGDEEEVPEDD